MSYFALNDYLSNGVQLTYAINWKGAKPSTTEAPYLSRDHVKVYEMELQEDDTLEVVSAITAFTFIDALTINLAAPVALNRYVRVVRETPSDYNLTRYTNTLVRPSDFEVTQRQLLFIAQETQDKAGISNLPFDITMDANRAEDAAEAAEVSAAEAAAEAALAASLVGTIHLKFSTYAAQIADTATYVNGQIADVLGYHAIADGGGIPMVWDAASTATHNGGTVRKPTAVSGAGRWLSIHPDVIDVRQFGARGDGTTDDTSAIVAAIATSTGSVIFPAGVYVVTKITISKSVKFLGMRGAAGAANVWPRLFLKNGTNTDMIHITTAGRLYADKIDFYGNKANQSLTGMQTSTGIYLEEDTTPSYVAANSIQLTECLVRNFVSKAIFCDKNRNGGRLYQCFLIDVDDAAFVLFGTDWYCASTEFGVCGGAALYVDFGASNDFVECEFYYTGQNPSYGASKSGIYVGTSVNSLSVSASQINACKHHGIECAQSGVGANYIFTGNQLGNNGLAVANTYSNIKVANNSVVIKGNNHWTLGQKPKYLIETYGGINRVAFDDNYLPTSYQTAVTNDETKVYNKSDYNGITLGDGGYYQSRKSANDRILKFYTSTDANEKFSIDGNGIVRWGAGGASTTDVALLRAGANVLGLAADDCFTTGKNTTANRPVAGSVLSGAMFYDTTLQKPIWSDGTNWRDAAGTVV